MIDTRRKFRNKKYTLYDIEYMRKAKTLPKNNVLKKQNITHVCKNIHVCVNYI